MLLARTWRLRLLALGATIAAIAAPGAIAAQQAGAGVTPLLLGTTMTLTVEPSEPLAGHPVQLVAKVKSGATGVTTGDVKFEQAGKTIESCKEVAVNSAGEASCPISAPQEANEYTVSAHYSDATLEYEAAEKSAKYTVLAASTAKPELLAPAASSQSTTPMTIVYRLPEAALPGSVELLFIKGAGETTLTLTNAASTQGEHSFALNVKNLAGNPAYVASATPGNELQDGEYTVVLAYQNAYGNPVASATSIGVTLKTLTAPPTISSPASGGIFPGSFTVLYELPEMASANTVALTFTGATVGVQRIVLRATESGPHAIEIVPAEPGAIAAVASAPAYLPDDSYSLVLSYQDALGNPAAASAPVSLTVSAPIPCLVGSYSPSGNEPCTAAPAGYYVARRGATAPTACPAGTSSTVAGASAVSACAALPTSSPASPPAPKCSASEPRHESSLRRTRAQVYTLHCTAPIKVALSAQARIRVGRHHTVVSTRTSVINVRAGSSSLTVHFKLSRATRRLLGQRGAHISISLVVYREAARGKLERMQTLTLAGRR